MNALESFNAYSRPSVRAQFGPPLVRLMQSVSSERWGDALPEIVELATLVQQHQIDDKLKDSDFINAQRAQLPFVECPTCGERCATDQLKCDECGHDLPAYDPVKRAQS